MNIIELKSVTHSYNDKFRGDTVLENVNLSIQGDTIYSIMGASGSGKSTLLNIMGGILKPTLGEVLINDNSISKMREKQLLEYRLHHIGYIFQSYNLIPFLTVEQNVFLPMRIQKRKTKDKMLFYGEIMQELGIMDKRQSYISELSGGQQQRVAIARCLVSDYDIILADEPTGSLDSNNTEKFLELMKKVVKEHHKTVVLVTHDNYVASFCEKNIYIRDGVVTVNAYNVNNLI